MERIYMCANEQPETPGLSPGICRRFRVAFLYQPDENRGRPT